MIPILIIMALGGLMHAVRSFALEAGTGTELAFGYLLLTAFFAGKIFSKLGLPKLTGYITSGIVVGPYVLDLVTKNMGVSLKVVNGVAVCILALTAGAELNFKRVKPVMRTLRAMSLLCVFGGIAALVGALMAMMPILPFFDNLSLMQSLAVAGVMAVALTAQSPAVVMAMVSETRADGPLTQVMLASVIVADLLVIVLFAVASALAVAAVGGGVDFRETELIGSMVFGIAVGMVLGIFVRTVQRGAALFTVMICIVVAEIGTRIHLDPLICMLSAGLWLENFSKADAHKLIADFESAQLPVFLVFFALAGAKLDIGALIASVIPVAVLALVRGFTFFTASTIACKQTGAEPVVRKFAWFGLVPQAGLALALALLIQKTFPTFGNEAAVIVFGVVAVNELIAPVILRALLLRSGEAGKREATDFVPH
jgi:Kef-type K+ transport system membrane component KefB